MEKQLTKQRPAYSLLELSKYFLKLGTWGFGGPVALVGYIHRVFGRKQRMANRGRI